MPKAVLPPNEQERLQALRRYQILDTPPEPGFDRITSLATRLFGTPIALITVVDAERQWFKSCCGFDVVEISRDLAFCAHTILTSEPLIVSDTRLDPRFADNPCVLGEPGVRFYAGAVLRSDDGYHLGTLCLIDTKPRPHLDLEQQAILLDLAALVADEFTLHLALHRGMESEQAERFLFQASAALASSLDYERTLDSVARLTLPYLADYCIVDLLEEDGQVRRPVAVHSNAGQQPLMDGLRRFPPGLKQGGPLPGVLQTGRSRLLGMVECTDLVESAQNEEHRLLRALAPQSSLVVPLIAREHTLGALTLGSTRPERYGSRELALAEDLAQRIALAVDNARLYKASQVASRAKDEFLATVSHELRTPLCNMTLAIRMLETTRIQKQRADYLRILKQQCMRETELINDLLDLQRLEEGGTAVKLERIDLQQWLPSVVEPFLVRVKERSQELRIDLSPDLPPLTSDRRSLERIVSELVNNACKYTPSRGHILVGILPAPDRLVLWVRNSGTEIPSQALPHLFERFYRVSGNETGLQGGTGLGLTLVQKLVFQLGGTIDVESQSGQTTFTVTLPLDCGVD